MLRMFCDKGQKCKNNHKTPLGFFKVWLNGKVQAQKSNIQWIKASGASQELNQSAKQQRDGKYA